MAERRTGVVFGASGIIGRNVAEHLVASGWNVIAVSRHGHDDLPGSRAIAVDLTDATASRAALAPIKDVTHAFICNWSRQADEAANCRVNAALVRSALEP